MSEKKLSSSLEDYLEAIHALSQERPFVHANQIAEYLRVAKSSVSWALGQLAKKGLINYKPYEAITLTDKGRTRAKQVANRHEEIKRFLTGVLAVDEATAQENACRMEHVIDREVLLRMKCFLDSFEDTATSAGSAEVAEDKVDDSLKIESSEIEAPPEAVQKQSKGRNRNTLLRLKEVLTASGRELSIPEAQVISAFLTIERHLSLDELFKEVRRGEPTLRREDVTEAMDILCEHKIARQLRLPNRVVYEHWHPESHHDHLFCVKCGAIIEFYDPRIEMLQMENARRSSFRLLQHSLNLYGVCDACVAREGNIRLLTECLAGESVQIMRVDGDETMKRHVADMGITNGNYVEVVSPEGPGKSVIVLVGQGRVMLDRETAEKIKVTAASDKHVPFRLRRRGRHRHMADRPGQGYFRNHSNNK